MLVSAGSASTQATSPGASAASSASRSLNSTTLTYSLGSTSQPMLPGRFYGWLEFLRTLCGPTLLRVKGIVNIDGRPGPTVIHGVQKAFHMPTELPAWPDDDHRTRLVFITRGYGQEIVTDTLTHLRACAAGSP